MNMNEWLEIGRVLIEWGFMIVKFGLGTMIVGALIIYVASCIYTTQSR